MRWGCYEYKKGKKSVANKKVIYEVYLHLLLRPKFWGDSSAGGPFPSPGSSLIVRRVCNRSLPLETGTSTTDETQNWGWHSNKAVFFAHGFPYKQRHSSLVELLKSRVQDYDDLSSSSSIDYYDCHFNSLLHCHHLTKSSSSRVESWDYLSQECIFLCYAVRRLWRER